MEEKKGFLIIGDDSFQNQALKEIFGQYNVSSQNIEYFEPNNHDWQKILISLKTYSLFGTPKFFVVINTNLLRQEEDTKQLLEKCTEAVANNDLDKSYELLIQAISSLGLEQNEYQEFLSDHSQIKTYFEDFAEDLDFIDAILKRYPLPENPPFKATLDFNNLISQIPQGHYLILTCEKVDKRTKNYKILEKNFKLIEKPDKKITERELLTSKEKVLENFIKSTKKTISNETFYYLRERVFETEQIHPALNKLEILTQDKSEITRYDVEEAFDNDFIPDSLKLSEFIKKSDMKSIHKIINNTNYEKTDYIKLAGLLKSLLKAAIKIKEQSEGIKYKDFRDFEYNFYNKNLEYKKQHPYYLYNCYSTFERFSVNKLLDAYKHLFDIEVSLKTTQKEPIDIFTDFFLNLFK